MNQENLISILTDQHLALKESLRLAGEESYEPSKYGEIYSHLTKFKSDLLGHLKLENESFYPDLLRKMKERNQDTANTEKFIAEMVGIGEVIMGFLDKYDSAELIGSRLAKFQAELQDIVSILILRVETEEEGVFQIYLAMAD